MLANIPTSHRDTIAAPLLMIQSANDVRVQRQDIGRCGDGAEGQQAAG